MHADPETGTTSGTQANVWVSEALRSLYREMTGMGPHDISAPEPYHGSDAKS